MPVRYEGTFNMSDTSDNVTEEQAPNETTKWHQQRAFVFHKCIESGDTIWPFTKAFCKIFMHSRPSPRDGDIDTEWMTAKAYTFRKLSKK